MNLHSLKKVDLPREKLARYGVKKLTDKELLAILLGSGIKGLNVLELSQKILTVIKKKGISRITLDNLLDIKGLGKAKASQVISVIELANRFTSEQTAEVLSPEDILNMCSDFKSSRKEHFVVFYIDTQNRLIERSIISIGILNSSLVHPREVFEPALKLSAASVIFAHNHPSGDTKPSSEDREVTKRLLEAAKILGIGVNDHVIVSNKGYFSFAQNNLL